MVRPPLVMFYPLLLAGILLLAGGCDRNAGRETVTVYCSVPEPYAAKTFAEFEKETGIHVAPLYDIESSKSIGLGAKLEAEQDHPRADVWWGNEAFLTSRLAEEDLLEHYDSPSGADIRPEFKDPRGMWAGVGLRARVIALGQPPPAFEVKSLDDLTDPRLKGQIAIARPTAGATGAHVAALYVVWGPERAKTFFRKLHDNGIVLLGGNAEVADQVGAGSFLAGLTDSDNIANAQAHGGKLTFVVPDQARDGTLAMPTTVALVKGSPHAAAARKLIDFLLTRRTEQRLIDMGFATWSVRAGPNGIKAMNVDYRKAADVFPQAVREATAILDGREQ